MLEAPRHPHHAYHLRSLLSINQQPVSHYILTPPTTTNTTTQPLLLVVLLVLLLPADYQSIGDIQDIFFPETGQKVSQPTCLPTY